jgi:ADP-heptose:LPS heptosyltransferase
MSGRKNISTDNNLLVVNTEKLGDVILCSDFLYALKESKRFEKYFIVLSEQYSELFDWDTLGWKPLVLNKNRYKVNLFYRFNFIKKVRALKCSEVINLAPERGTINEEITLTSGGLKKLALKETSLFMNSFFLKRNNSKYTLFLENNEQNEYKKIMSYLGKQIPAAPKQIFRSSSAPIPFKQYIVIAPMASEMDRTWGLNKYASLINELYSHNIVLLGTASEITPLQKLAEGKENVFMAAGKTTLHQTVEIIKRSRLFIGNDSGLTHLAHQLEVPVIALAGGGKYGIFFPYKERSNAMFLAEKMDCFGCHWKCIYDEKYCLTKVSVDSVKKLALEMLIED